MHGMSHSQPESMSMSHIIYIGIIIAWLILISLVALSEEDYGKMLPSIQEARNHLGLDPGRLRVGASIISSPFLLPSASYTSA